MGLPVIFGLERNPLKARTRKFAVVASLLLGAATAPGQNWVKGQVFLPSGQAIGETVEFRLESSDPRRPSDIFYTDSEGRIYIRNVNRLDTYRVFIRGDGKRYSDTTVNFVPASQPYLTVHLEPLVEEKVVTKKPTVSVDELGYVPNPPALEAYQKGLAEVREARFDKARGYFERAIQLDQGFARAYNDLAVIYMGEKNYPEAEKLLRQAIEKDAHGVHAFFNLGSTLNREERYQEAVEPLRMALKLEPRWTNAEAQLGVALLQSGRGEEALPCLESGIRSQGPEQVYAYMYLGKRYASSGDLAHAIAAWEKYLELDSTSPAATQVRQLLEQYRNKAKAAPGPLATATASCQ